MVLTLKYNLGLFFVLFFFISSSFSQRGSLIHHKEKIEIIHFNDSLKDIIDSIKASMPYLKTELNTSNKAVFWGRTFGLNQFSVEPCLIFKTNKGFYFYNTNYYWSKDALPNLFAKSDLGIGYEKDISENFSFSINYERWLYYNGGENVKKAIQNSTELQLFYAFNYLNLEAVSYYMFGDYKIFETDFKISQEFHLHTFSKNCYLYVFPELTSIFANKNFLPIYSVVQPTMNNRNYFRLIDLELTIPFRLELKNFDFEPTFHYNKPIKQVNENVSAFIYFSLGLSYNFYFDKKKQLKTLYEKYK